MILQSLHHLFIRVDGWSPSYWGINLVVFRRGKDVRLVVDIISWIKIIHLVLYSLFIGILFNFLENIFHLSLVLHNAIGVIDVQSRFQILRLFCLLQLLVFFGNLGISCFWWWLQCILNFLACFLGWSLGFGGLNWIRFRSLRISLCGLRGCVFSLRRGFFGCLGFLLIEAVFNLVFDVILGLGVFGVGIGAGSGAGHGG